MTQFWTKYIRHGLQKTHGAKRIPMTTFTEQTRLLPGCASFGYWQLFVTYTFSSNNRLAVGWWFYHTWSLSPSKLLAMWVYSNHSCRSVPFIIFFFIGGDCCNCSNLFFVHGNGIPVGWGPMGTSAAKGAWHLAQRNSEGFQYNINTSLGITIWHLVAWGKYWFFSFPIWDPPLFGQGSHQALKSIWVPLIHQPSSTFLPTGPGFGACFGGWPKKKRKH